MQRVYSKKQTRGRYIPREDAGNAEKTSVKFMFKLITVVVVICAIVCIKKLDADLFTDVKAGIDYVINTNYTYSDIADGVKDSVRFIKELIVL